MGSRRVPAVKASHDRNGRAPGAQVQNNALLRLQAGMRPSTDRAGGNFPDKNSSSGCLTIVHHAHLPGLILTPIGFFFKKAAHKSSSSTENEASPVFGGGMFSARQPATH
jgi:hypothetical protein